VEVALDACVRGAVSLRCAVERCAAATPLCEPLHYRGASFRVACCCRRMQHFSCDAPLAMRLSVSC
jgi:hypothetical protein